ncbi:MAG: PAS domain-containing sensor histidine kinase [Bacteroidota bacterium]
MIDSEQINVLPMAVLVAASDGRVLQANRAAQHLLGVTTDGSVCHHPMPAHSDAWARLLAGATATEHLAWTSPEGAARCVQVVAYPHGNGAWLVAATEVSSWHTAQQALEAERDEALETARTDSELLGKISHEVRTSLASIVGFAELLALETEEPQLELVSLIGESGRRALGILQSVMDLSRMRSKAAELDRVVTDVGAQVETKVRLTQPLAEAKGLELTCTRPSTPCLAEVHLVSLDRILNNLFDNAIKYTDAGYVRVAVACVGQQVQIEVIDSGLGIDAAFLPKLFQPFERDNRSAQNRSGVGLGLAITRYLVRLMGGDIQVTSAKGEGSRFVVSFPQVA